MSSKMRGEWKEGRYLPREAGGERQAVQGGVTEGVTSVVGAVLLPSPPSQRQIRGQKPLESV